MGDTERLTGGGPGIPRPAVPDLQDRRTPDSFRILIATDNENLRQTLLQSLSVAGFGLECVRTAVEAITAHGERVYDLVLLSLCSTNIQDIETCRYLRSMSPDVGIVMLRLDGTSEQEILALDAGADDCIASPFRYREMVARLRAVLRRVHTPIPKISPGLRAGDLVLDPLRRLLFRAGQEIHLSPREYDLLLFLMENQEQPLTHMKLLRSVWGGDSRAGAGHLRSYIKALRKKIESDPAQPQYILTEPWVGYRFHNPGR